MVILGTDIETTSLGWALVSEISHKDLQDSDIP